MSEMAYPEDAVGKNIAAEESQEISPDDLEATSLPDISVISGAADDDDDAEAAAATRSTGCNSNKGAKMGVALLALSAIVFSAVIFGTSNANKGPPPSLSSSSKIAQAIEVEPTMKPTMKKPKPLKVEKIDDAKTSAPTKAKATKQPAIPPKPAPLKVTPFPTEEATNQVTETVSTETTGPPTVAARNDTRI
mmetsp:Transcript_21510/g.43168  ORF Transcript_21510/g.43168 Transcript_21510/m.43168 type:complete len:192 (-) Transcript_21510:174-749(-)